METLQTVVAAHLKERGFRYSFNAERSVFDFGVAGDKGNWKVYIVAEEERRLVQIISICPINAPRDKYQPMCELLNRINDNILFGKFCMDFEDGQVRLVTASIYVDTELSSATLYHLLQTNLDCFDEYLPAIIGVIYGHNQPLLAFLETKRATANLN